MRPIDCPVTILNTLDPLGSGPTWLFDIDTLTKSMNYQPVIVGNQPNPSADPQNTNDDTTFKVKEPEFEDEKPESEVHVSPNSSAKTKKHDAKTKGEAKGKSLVELSIVPVVGQISTNSTNTFSAAISPTLGKSSYVDPSQYPDDPNMPALEDITYSDDEEDVGAEADFSNLETTITVSPIPTTRVHKNNLVTQIIGDLSSATQKRSMTRMVKDQGGLAQINNEDFHTCMFACFLSQEEPKRVHQALKDPSWIEAMQKELLQFKMQKMDVKSAFLYGTIKEDVYVCQPPGFEDPDYPNKVYKVVKALYGLHQAPRAWKFGLTDGKSASTPIDTEKPLLKDPDGEDVDVHTYRLMIGSLMYLTSLRLDIMFAVCACARFQVTPKASHLHAVKRIFRRKVIITEDTVRQALRLDDAESIDCLPNEEIFAELARMSSSIASAIICLAAGRKFNFSKYIFDSLVRNVDSSSKLYMYPRFVQLMISTQIVDLSSHTTKYTSSVLIQKVFSDMRKVGKGFSPHLCGNKLPYNHGVVRADVVANDVADVVVDADVEPIPPSPTPTTTPPPPQHKVASTPPSSPHQSHLLNTLLETCTTLTRKVEALEQDNIAQAFEITKLKQRVRRLEKKNKLKASGLKRLRKVGNPQRVESSADTVMDDQEDASKQGG
nr:hypothetical protein [Tanacetum cinerariifolium]